MFRLLVLICSLFCASAYAAEKGLTPEQQKEAGKFADNVEKECLAGSPVPENADFMIKKTLEWARDPENCRCMAKRIHESLMPEVFRYTAEQFRQYLRPVTFKASLECATPVVKKRFGESCEELASNLGEKGQHLLDCDCLRSNIGKTTDQEWIDLSLAQYNAYQEEKRTGKPRVKPAPGPVDTMMEQCIRKDRLSESVNNP